MNNYDRPQRPAPQGNPRRSSYDYNDIYGNGSRRSNISGMMQTDNYKSMREGSIDSLEDDFEDIPPQRVNPRRAANGAQQRPAPPQQKRPAPPQQSRDEFYSDEFDDFDSEFGDTAVAQDGFSDDFRDDFADFGYGFDSFEPEVTTRKSGAASSLSEYRAMRGQQNYTVRETVPKRAAQPVRGGFDDFDSDFDDDFSDDFEDDFGGAVARTPQRASVQTDFEDDFADDFTDDFDVPTPVAPQSRPAPPQSRPMPPSQSRPAPPQSRPMPPQSRPVPPSQRGGNLTAEQQDLVNRRPQGMPEFYAQFLVSGEADERRRAKKASANKSKMRRIAIIASGCVAAVAIIVVVAVLLALRPTNPIEVRSGFDEVDSTILYSLLKTSVDEKLGRESVSINVNGTVRKISLKDYGFSYATPGTAETSYLDIISGSEIVGRESLVSDGSIIVNETRLKELLTSLAATQGDTMIEPYYEINGDQLTIYAGTDGVGIEYDKFLTDLKSCVRNGSGEMTANVHVIEAPEVDMDKIYSEVACEPADASTTTSATGEMVFVSEVVGKDFDLDIAKRVVSAGGESWSITMTLTQPKVSLVELRAPYCLDLLSSWTSKFNNTSNKARASNIALAAEAINGTIIQPGEKISFNNIVGERTIEKGYSYATVYTSEGADTGVGGGICQVSSTLYYTALLCNLKIPRAEDKEEQGRFNHAYSVSYMDVVGTDATVSWPWPDLYIVNNKEYPVKIVMYVTDGEGDDAGKGLLHCEYWGTADGISCVIKSSNANYVAPKKIYKHATDSKSGTTIGAAGYTATTYRYVYYNGEYQYRVKEAESTYSPLNIVVYTNSLPAGASWAD